MKNIIFTYMIRTSLAACFVFLSSCSSASDDPSDLFADVIYLEIPSDVINTRSPLFFGQNYWNWIPEWGNPIHGTDEIIKPLNIKLFRFGGAQNDAEYPTKLDTQYIQAYIDYCIAIGAEPYIQLPVLSSDNLVDRKRRMFEIMDYTLQIYPALKYVGIGNEPDAYATWFSKLFPNAKSFSNYQVTDLINDYNDVAQALKTRYPQIVIIGPELAYRYMDNQDGDWLSPFIAGCKDSVDIASIHLYPFQTVGQCTYDNAKAGFFTVKERLRIVQGKIRNNAGGRNIPLAITEADITYDTDPAHGTNVASPETFYSGLWLADCIGVLSGEKDIVSFMPWSICGTWKDGFLDRGTKLPVPSYYVYQMFSTLGKSQCISIQSAGDIRLYAYKDTVGGYSIFIVNWNRTMNIPVHFSISEQSAEYTVPPSSLTCLVLDKDFSNRKAYEYSINDARRNTGYRVTDWK